MRFWILLCTLLLSLTCLSQSTVKNDTISGVFKSIEGILKDSEVINQETFDLIFLLRVLPDNGWFLKLNKDSTYEYIHWSGWGKPEGSTIEKGKYRITNNLIKLKSKNIISKLISRTFYLVTSNSDEIDNNIIIDCVENNSITYCLYQK